MSFNITQSNGTKQACGILLQSPDDSENINSWSFYNHRCGRTNFWVSWGYNSTGDFAVMTVCR